MSLLDFANLAPGHDAWVFPGQGAQRIGMSLDFAADDARIQELFAEANEVLGYSLSQLIEDGPEEELTKTIHTQPAVFVASIAALLAAQVAGLLSRPLFVAGHSLGEYSAVVAVGGLSFADGLRLVQERASLMQEASESNPGTLAALLGATVEEAEALAAATGAEVCNHNAPGQVVLGGSLQAMDAVSERAGEFGVRRISRLKVGGAFHTTLMKPAAEGLASYLSTLVLTDLTVPLVANGSGKPMTAAGEIKDELQNQPDHPVRWEESVRTMIAGGATRFMEFGPGNVLSGMIKRIDPSVSTVNVATVDDLATAALT